MKSNILGKFMKALFIQCIDIEGHHIEMLNKTLKRNAWD